MGVTIRKRAGKWYVYVNHNGRRKAKCIGTRAAAEEVRRKLQAALALGNFGVLAKAEAEPKIPTFGEYARSWQKQYAEI